MLWKAHHHEPRRDEISVPDWKEVSMGKGIQIGEVDHRPVCVDIRYAFINGKKVMFYDGCSQIVDYQMVEDWLRGYTLNTIRWDGGHRWAHCNSTNFHHCLDAVGATESWRKSKGHT